MPNQSGLPTSRAANAELIRRIATGHRTQSASKDARAELARRGFTTQQRNDAIQAARDVLASRGGSDQDRIRHAAAVSLSGLGSS